MHIDHIKRNDNSLNQKLIFQLINKLSSSLLEEERFAALRPIISLMDYYQQPFLGFSDPRIKKEHLECLHGLN